MSKKDQVVAQIARDVLRIDTLEPQKIDRVDFHSVHVDSVKEALEKAYQEGMKAGVQ